MQTQLFYRVERSSVEDFLEGPHYSEPITGAELDCPWCKGHGEIPVEFDPVTGEWETEECEFCEGNGWVDYDPDLPEHRQLWRREGVSCFETPEELYEYFTSGMFLPEHLTEEVIIFAGEVVGEGLDGEPLVIPAGTPRPRKISWKQFCRVISRRKSHQEEVI